MLRTLLLSSILSIFAVTVSAQSLFPYKYEETKLENGLRIVLIPMKNAGLVSYFTVVRAGARDEVEPGKSGFAHFFEHMMFRGTEKYPAEKYNQIVMEMGADTNASTSDDRTIYYVHFPSRYLDQVIELQADKFMNTSYSLEAFQTEAKAILGEYNKNFANPLFQITVRLRDITFEKSTYKHTAMGFLKDIQDMSNQYEYSLQFFKRFYRPDNSVILITGDFDPAAALVSIKKHYSSWKPGAHKTVNFEEPEQTAEKQGKVDYPGNTLPMLALAYKAPLFTPENREFAALSLLGELVFGQTSDLYRQLVLKEQKVDLMLTDFDPHRDPYLFMVLARLKKVEDLQSVEKTITDAVEKLKSTPPDAKRLTALKSNLKYTFLMGLDTSKKTAAALARYLAIVDSISDIEKTFQTYDSITPEEIQKAAQKYLLVEKRTVVTLTGAKQ
ncbi:MAG TPA: pitrilysin family protein [Acidobacteriota bacterium]|nr:pitrilysin family protein [Acidobacteriota bacterium]